MCAAAILTGGRATRFGGRDKGALLVDGQSIRDRQIAMLSSVVQEVLIVGAGAAEGGAGPQACVENGSSKELPHTPIRFVPDRIAGCGPLGGVHAALEHAAHDAVFVAACDMPFLTSPFVAHLLDLSRDVDVVLPRTERGDHPL